MPHKKLFLSLFTMFFLQITIAQRTVTAIDQKGTKIKITNNKVTDSVAAPAIAKSISNDIFLKSIVVANDTLGKVNIFDGTKWVSLEHKGTKGSIFFAAEWGWPTEDNSQLFWNADNNRLGVGTNSPTNKLEVSGAIGAQGILNSDGTENEPSFRFKDDTNTGIYSPAADEIGFTVGGVEAMKIYEPIKNNTVVIINQALELKGTLIDALSSAGTAGQVLSSTGTKTAWIDPKLVNVLPLTADYLLNSADSGKVITITSDKATTITVPSTLPVGYNVSIYQLGVGTITIAGSGVTVLNRLSRFKTAGKDAGVGLLITATNTAHLTGDLKK